MLVKCTIEKKYNLNLVLNEEELLIIKTIVSHINKNQLKLLLETELNKEFDFKQDIDKFYEIYQSFIAIRNVNLELP
jgi:hypothetical protein